MAAFAPILAATIVDLASVSTTSATVSTDTTFDPEGYVTPGVARYVDRAGGIQVGYPALTLSIRRPNQGSRMNKVTMKLVRPTLETISNSTVSGILPAPQRAYDCSIVLEAMLPERSTLAERTALLKQFVGLFVTTLYASDGSPSSVTSSPISASILTGEMPY
jgi:hypothetical protein